MKSDLTIISHTSSYTSRFARDFAKAWQQHFLEDITILDLASPLAAGKVSLVSRPAKNTELHVNQRGLQIAYAFHPQASFEGCSGNQYREQALITAYTTALASARCPNIPFAGTWGLHLSFLHGRRLLYDCGLNLERVEERVQASRSLPAIRPYQSFLVPNLIATLGKQNGTSLEFSELTTDWQETLTYIHLIGDQQHVFNRDSNQVAAIEKPYRKLQGLLSHHAIEIVASKSGKILGIHPCLTRFPAQTLRLLKQRMSM